MRPYEWTLDVVVDLDRVVAIRLEPEHKRYLGEFTVLEGACIRVMLEGEHDVVRKWSHGADQAVIREEYRLVMAAWARWPADCPNGPPSPTTAKDRQFKPASEWFRPQDQHAAAVRGPWHRPHRWRTPGWGRPGSDWSWVRPRVTT